MSVRWEGGVFGHVVVGETNSTILNSPSDVSRFLLEAVHLSAEDARSLGRMCYFMCIREARRNRDGFVLAGADKWFDSLSNPEFPPEAQRAAYEFKEQLFSVRTEPGHVLLEHAFKNLSAP
jgi:hypothetical protein